MFQRANLSWRNGSASAYRYYLVIRVPYNTNLPSIYFLYNSGARPSPSAEPLISMVFVESKFIEYLLIVRLPSSDAFMKLNRNCFFSRPIDIDMSFLWKSDRKVVCRLIETVWQYDNHSRILLLSIRWNIFIFSVPRPQRRLNEFWWQL